jgi:NAD(P)-dependent dehydrogenase (short-subunit alcohol dehydrogenase family)
MNDDFGIAGKTALVTGSGRNIGRAIVLEFAGRGDEIVLDAITGRLDLLVDEQELARRAADAPPSDSLPARGYERLHVEHVLQADQGCDLDFLVDYDWQQQSLDLQHTGKEIHQ